MNAGLNKLQPYPFEKLRKLFNGINPPAELSPIDLSIGEPKHKTPDFILEELKQHLPEVANYPVTRGINELRQAFVDWLIKRFRLPSASLNADHHVLPVNGTREAIFALAQCIINNQNNNPLVIMPNPFYQIYEGAAFLAGAEPYYINCLESSSFLPDFDSVPAEVWKRCQLLYLCSPGNPTGAVFNQATYEKILILADQYEFVVAADECYSEIYFDEDNPPLGLLQAATNSGRDDFNRCIVFHSLSKRSNVPGLRSGFVAGDKKIIEAFLRYRTYHGCAMPPHTQAASILAWQDDSHVKENRALYREKFDNVLKILSPNLKVSYPDASFYLWPEVPVADTDFARDLYQTQNITVLPGSYLSRAVNDINPGKNRLRIALVAPLDECIDAAERLRNFLNLL